MAVEKRKDRNRWGFRLYLNGRLFRKQYAWKTQTEAEQAYQTAREEVEQIRKLPATSLHVAAVGYLEWLGRRRSKYRYKGVKYNLERWILPYFGAETLVTQITSQQVEEFLEHHKQRVSLMTVWHYIKDLNALLNYCIRQGILRDNPVRNADRSELRFRVKRKLPMDPEIVERGASALEGVHRAYYDFLRFTGARRDEGNKLKWEDLDLDRGLFLMPGSKTPEAADVRPLPTQLIKRLLELPRTSEYVFPASHGGKAFDRRKVFSKVSTAVGTRITAKDLRDWFGTQVVARTSDPRQIMDLMRHTNLRTTTTYMRRVSGELRSIVESLGELKNG